MPRTMKVLYVELLLFHSLPTYHTSEHIGIRRDARILVVPQEEELRQEFCL